MTEAGYSGTPLPKKLGIKDGQRVAFVGAPPAFTDRFPDLPFRRQLRGPLDLIVLFVATQRDLAKRLPAAKAVLHPAGSLWVAWPKQASKVQTDVNENTVRDAALAGGLVDVKVIAIDETWSGLKLMFRLADRPPAP